MNGYFAKQKLGGAGHVHPYLFTPGGPNCTFLYSLFAYGRTKKITTCIHFTDREK